MAGQTSNRFHGELIGPENPVVGRLRTVSSLDTTEKVEDGDVVYLSRSVDPIENMILFSSLVKSGTQAVLTDHIGATDHGIIMANEMGVPCVRGISREITEYESEEVLVNGGEVCVGDIDCPRGSDFQDLRITERPIDEHLRINLGFPEVVDLRPEIVEVVDGVGFMRLEFVMIDILKDYHPFTFVECHSAAELAGLVAERIEPVLEAFDPKPVWIRTDDFSVSLLRRMKGGERYEKEEQHSVMGWRGISRSIDDPRLIGPQFEALRRTLEEGYRNIGLFPPMTRFPSEYRTWKQMALDAGLEDVTFGVMIETPSAALTFEDLIPEIEFATFGTNDLTQFTLAIDRANEQLKAEYAADSPPVLALMERVIDLCRDHGIESSIGGRAASDPTLVEALLEYGISGFSVNPDPRTVNEMYAHLAEHDRRDSL